MTRFHYVIASLVVISAVSYILNIFSRLNDHEFIMRSFHEHGNAAVSATTNTRRNLVASKNYATAILETDDYKPGEFCPICRYSDDIVCSGRVEFLMERYSIPRSEAMENKEMLSRCGTPTIVHRVHDEEHEPSVILHAGPHKTGTTALQAFIYDLMYANHTLFLEDNLRVPTYDELPGVFGKEGVGLNLPHCCLPGFKEDGGLMNVGMCGPMRKAFPTFVQDAYNKSQNILIVAEDFDRAKLDFDRLRFYLQPYKKIKVAVTYRRLHDWLPSWYNQIVDAYTITYAKGEDKYPSFVEWLDANYDEFLDAHGIRVADRYRNQSFVESVHLINVHEVGKKSIERYFCNHLKARSVCQAIREGRTPSKSNVGTDHDYQRFLIEAKHRGKILNHLSKPIQIIKGEKYLKTKVEEMNVTLPKICTRDALLEQIFQREMENENAFFPEWYESQGGEKGLRQSFDAAVKKKFCTLDLDKIFDSGVLDSVFEDFPRGFTY